MAPSVGTTRGRRPGAPWPNRRASLMTAVYIILSVSEAPLKTLCRHHGLSLPSRVTFPMSPSWAFDLYLGYSQRVLVGGGL